MKKTDNNTQSIKPTKKRARHSNWEENAADDLKQRALREDFYAIEEFYTSRNIPKRTWDDAVARNEVLKEANEFAKIRCGLNREKLAMKNNLGMNSVTGFSLSQFLQRWKDDIQWRQELKNKEEEGKSKNITIVMEPFNKDE